MIPVIKEIPTPDWLCDIQEVTSDIQPFPLTKILENSLYYPACDIDGLPVEYLAGLVHSFIYVDYAVGRERIASRLEGRRGRNFRGYRLIGMRDVSRSELTPTGWHPSVILTPEDGDPRKYDYSF